MEFAPLSALLIKTPVSGSSATPSVSGANLGYASLYVDYVYLDTDERRRFAQVSHEYLIEQLQFTGGESVSSSANKLRLNFNHPVKELLWVVQQDDAVAKNQWAKYTVTSSSGKEVNPVVDAKLQLNGHDRFSTREGGYFNLVQPFQHHRNIPTSRGINVYSFGLTPEEHQPSGTCNFSRIDNATLNLTLVPGLGSAQVRIYAVNYNVLRIMSGMGKHKTAHNSQLLFRFQLIPIQINSKRVWSLSVSMIYNWLVIDDKAIATISNCWKLLRASISALILKKMSGSQVNDLGRNNIEDWMISSQASKPKTVGMKTVQRLDDIGLFSIESGLRYSPASKRKLEYLRVSHILTKLFYYKPSYFLQKCSCFEIIINTILIFDARIPYSFVTPLYDAYAMVNLKKIHQISILTKV